MAQNFRNQIARNTGTSAVDILNAVDSYDTVIGIRLANVHTASISVNVFIVRSSTNYFLVKSAPIPVGGSLELIDGGAKVVLQSGDKIQAISTAANSLDSVVSYIDTIST